MLNLQDNSPLTSGIQTFRKTPDDRKNKDTWKTSARYIGQYLVPTSPSRESNKYIMERREAT